MSRGHAEQHLRRAFRTPAVLFPVLQRADTDPEQSRELGLAQPESRSQPAR